MPYVYSTLANTQAYAFYTNGGGDLPVLDEKIVIKGGTGVATKLLQTPKGIATHITDAQLERLQTHSCFQEHLKNGFVKFDESEKKMAIKKAVADMNSKDKSAPKTPEDYANKKGPKPVLNTGNS